MDDLNERAATGVMGWKEYWYANRRIVDYGPFIGKSTPMWIWEGSGLLPQSDFDPLHVWRDAGLLAEEMHKKGFGMSLHMQLPAGWICLIRKPGWPGSRLIEGDTGPAAICRAAVSACEKEKG